MTQLNLPGDWEELAGELNSGGDVKSSISDCDGLKDACGSKGVSTRLAANFGTSIVPHLSLYS